MYWIIFSNEKECMAQIAFRVHSLHHISLMSFTFDDVKQCHVDGNVHGSYMQMRLCIVKLGVSSI